MTTNEGNPYAMRDAMQAQREADNERFALWCEANDVDAYAEDANARYDAYLAGEDDDA